LHPWLVFGLFLLITIFITWRDLKRHKQSKWFDAIVFGVVGLLGVLLFVLWTATDHRAAARNLNILWAMPLHVVFVPLYLMSKKIARPYFRAVAILNALLILTWAWLPQQLNVFLIPVVIALTIRAWRIGWK
jgi:putative effector of murein hydrolase